jgi:hypothetical protein
MCATTGVGAILVITKMRPMSVVTLFAYCPGHWKAIISSHASHFLVAPFDVATVLGDCRSSAFYL